MRVFTQLFEMKGFDREVGEEFVLNHPVLQIGPSVPSVLS